MRKRSTFSVLAVVGLGLALLPAPVLWAAPKVQIKTFMRSTGVDRNAKGKILVVQNKAQSAVTIKVQNLKPRTSYDVVVDGAVQESFMTNAGGSARIGHRARKKGAALAYDPRGSHVVIASSGDDVLVADVPSTPEEGSQTIEIEFQLTPASGVAGTAKAEYKERCGRMRFSVSLQDATPGDYDLFVGGVQQGVISVGIDGAGEIQFDTRPSSEDDDTPSISVSHGGDDNGQGDDNDGENEDDDSFDSLLTFDPRGMDIEVQQMGAVLFSGTFPLMP